MTILNPQTTPRHQLRAEKARRNKGETGSATGSRNRSNALAAFIAKKTEIDEMLARLQALSDDHFNSHPDEINWGDVGTLEHYASLLKRITDSAFCEANTRSEQTPPERSPPHGGLHPVEAPACRMGQTRRPTMTQIQLSDAQAVILSTACAREDGAVFPVTAGLKGGAVGNVCKSLLKQGLIEEIPATDLNTVYRHDEKRGPVTLRATPLAYTALGITDAPDTQDEDLTEAAPQPVRRRSGTKQEALIAMLRAEGGATIDEIVAALGWRRHTVRGAMSGALKKKLGLTITSEKVEGRGRVYKIEPSTL